MNGVEILDHRNLPNLEKSLVYHELRRAGVTLEEAEQTVKDRFILKFARKTKPAKADGSVAGAMATAHSPRRHCVALGVREGFKIVSSFFLDGRSR